MSFCFSHSDKIFFEADIFAKEVAELYRLDKQKSEVVPVGVDLNFIDQLFKNGAPHINRRQLGLKDDDIILMTVNRLAADKGVDKIVLALSQLVKEYPQMKLLVIGQGYQEKEILNLIEEKGLKHHVCHLKNIPEKELYFYYRLADIYLSVFSFLGSSISSLEAMACSLPLITTAQPWLVKDGRNGLVINDNNPATIQAAITNLIKQNKLKVMGQESRRIVQEFDWDSIAANAVTKYEKLLNQRMSYEKI